MSHSTDPKATGESTSGRLLQFGRPAAEPDEPPRRADEFDAEDREVGPRLQALLEGDASAAAWLYDTFSRSLFRRLYHRYHGQPGVDIEDVLHDAFVVFYRNDAKLLRDYLRRTAPEDRSLAGLERRLWDLTCGLVANRRRAARSRSFVPLPSFDRPSPQPTPDKDLLGRDELDHLDACLKAKGQRLYLYFRLRFEDGLAPREIVVATGWSKKATYKLRQALDEAIAACCKSLGVGLSQQPSTP